MPKVSVLTPIYKTNPQYLRECIESILNQTFTDFEFLILNDSPDELHLDEIVKSYKDKRIKYFKNDINMGISESRNKLLSLARGEYLAILDHDDISMPERLEKQAAYLDANKNVGVVGCNTIWFPKIEYQKYPTDNLSIKLKLTRVCCIPHSGAMIRKSVMDDNGIKWESQYSPCEDYMLWVCLMDKTSFYNIPEFLLKYRNCDNNTTHLQRERMIEKDGEIRNFIFRQYPYWAQTMQDDNIKRRWVKLFAFIPLFRITRGRSDKIKFYLFGFIPFVAIHNEYKKWL